MGYKGGCVILDVVCVGFVKGLVVGDVVGDVVVCYYGKVYVGNG